MSNVKTSVSLVKAKILSLTKIMSVVQNIDFTVEILCPDHRNQAEEHDDFTKAADLFEVAPCIGARQACA